MEQIASDVAGRSVTILFQPHVGPFDRGILSTVYMEPKKTVDALVKDIAVRNKKRQSDLRKNMSDKFLRARIVFGELVKASKSHEDAVGTWRKPY